MKPFDIFSTRLQGVKLIEAGAGTGKTYTIAGLFLRCVIELKLAVDQILVVTYTNAATEELKSRIRRRLLEARDGIARQQSEDRFIGEVIARYSADTEALSHLDAAIIDFDRAAIHTIHGFCARILHEHAFEAGSLYDTELLRDTSGLYREIADDFWRRHVIEAPPEFIGFLATEKKITGPSHFTELLSLVNVPGLTILPDVQPFSLDCLESYRRLFLQVASAWRRCRWAVLELLRSPLLNAVVYGGTRPGPTGRSTKTAILADRMDVFCRSGAVGFPLFAGFEKFTRKVVLKSTKKNQPAPAHEFFDLCQKLQDEGFSLGREMEHFLIHLQREFFDFARRALEQKKTGGSLRSYDDLLLQVHRGLETEKNDALNPLTRMIRRKYRAALVDEFQDTDSMQYQIFHRLFTGPERLLFMIGDPKQSIYGFRGADLFSYLHAAGEADEGYTLQRNWRASPGLIEAVNTVFTHHEKPFFYDGIAFQRAIPGHTSASKKEREPSLHLWYLPGAGEKPLNKTDAERIISEAVAAEISELVSYRGHCLPTEAIAVLVRTNRQARTVKASLNDRGVPAVLYGAGNIFDSDEAEHLQRLLHGVLEPGNERRFRAALAADMLGVSANQIEYESAEEQSWEIRRARFREYAELWRRRGFLKMFRRMLFEEHIPSRILAFQDGERRMTNILHLTELLHRKSIVDGLGSEELLGWLASRRDPSAARLEEHQLRLESDDRAVKIVTIHKSKGLEYPVVFCPFTWEGAAAVRPGKVLVHDPHKPTSRILDLGSERFSRHQALYTQEVLAENLRLLYVAMTRAKRSCYLVWGRINTAETSALAYILHGSDPQAAPEPLAALQAHMAACDDAALLGGLEELVAKSNGTIGLRILGEPRRLRLKKAIAGEKALNCRYYSARFSRSWKVTSYSALTAGHEIDTEKAESDLLERMRDGERSPGPVEGGSELSGTPSIFSFPRGTRAGIFFHDLLEQIDFINESENYRNGVVRDRLQAHGFDSRWVPAVRRAVDNVLDSRLTAGPLSFSLNTISRNRRIDEMEFYIPLKKITPRRLERLFHRGGTGHLSEGFADSLGKLRFSPAEGYLKGYIDLVFEHEGRTYLLDWKSNFLGPTIDQYGPDQLNRTMGAEHYELQLHLYALALDRYLRLKVTNYRYDMNFGGAIYIFIRGVSEPPGSESGVYYHRPHPDTIKALAEGLIPAAPV